MKNEARGAKNEAKNETSGNHLVLTMGLQNACFVQKQATAMYKRKLYLSE